MRAFIIFRDRVTYARRCLLALTAAGLEPVIIDQGSTWPEAVRWLEHLEAHGVLVLRRGGGHPRDIWGWAPFRETCGGERYIVTDPDTVPSADCPGDWPARLGAVLDAAGTAKAGLGLRIDDVPESYPRRDQVLAWEAQFWTRETVPGVYSASVDTTLALYRPLAEHGEFTLDAVRTGAPYLARHLAWYERPETLPAEIRYYHEHAEQGISFWTIGGRSAWGN